MIFCEKSDMVITIESYVIEKRDGNVSFNDRDFRRIPLYSVLFHFIRKNRIFKFFEIRKIKLTLKLKRQIIIKGCGECVTPLCTRTIQPQRIECDLNDTAHFLKKMLF